MNIEEAKRIFGIDKNDNLDNLKSRFRELAKKCHPDVGGDIGSMSKINQAYSALKKDLSSKRNSGSTDITVYKPQGGALIPYEGGTIAKIGESIGEIIPFVGGALGQVLGGLGVLTETAGRAIIEIIQQKVEEHEERKEEEELYKFNPNDVFEILEALQRTEDFRILKDINPKFLKDPFFMRAAIDIVPESVYYADNTLKDDADFMLEVYDNNPELLFFASDRLKNDKDFILRAVEIYPCGTLEFCNRSFRTDEDVIKKAVSLDGLAYQYASFELQSNREILTLALNQNSKVIDMINPTIVASQNLLADKSYVMAAIKEGKDDIVLKSSDELWKDPEFAKTALKYNKNTINRVDPALLNDVEFVKSIIEIDSSFIGKAGNEVKHNEEFALYCVQKDGHNLQYFGNDMKSNKTVVSAALDNNTEAFVYATPGLALDEKYLTQIAEKYGIGINKPLFEEKKYLEMAIKLNGMDAWEKALEVNKHCYDIDILIKVLRQENSIDSERLYSMVYNQKNCKCLACGGYDEKGDYKITVNGEPRKVMAPPCEKCGAQMTHTDFDLVRLFEFEYNLSKHNYVEFNSYQADYIIKRAEEMGKIDFNVIKYFPDDRKNDMEYMVGLVDKFGIQAINYYTGENKSAIARMCIQKCGIESIGKLSPAYTENESFIAHAIHDYGSEILNYIDIDKIDVKAVKEKAAKIKELEDLKNQLNVFNKTSSSININTEQVEETTRKIA